MNRRGFLSRVSVVAFAALLPVRMAKSKWRPEDIEVAKFSDYDSVFDDFEGLYKAIDISPYRKSIEESFYKFGTVTNQMIPFEKRGTSGE